MATRQTTIKKRSREQARAERREVKQVRRAERRVERSEAHIGDPTLIDPTIEAAK
jgi:hypothetical protein